MYAAPVVNKLDLLQSGMDPSAFETWRREAFDAVLASRSGSGFAGASLAYARGTMDLEVLKDSECPGSMTAVCPMTKFLGVNFMVPLSKDEVYAYVENWYNAGRPDNFVWPVAAGMQPAAPVPIPANDPCRSVRPREQLTPAMRQRMISEGRSTDWKPYKRSIDGAFAIIQSRMTDSMMRSLEEEARYARAVIEGDLLAAINQIKIKAIGGYRLLPMIVSRAISDVLDPRKNNHEQQEREPAEEYTARFKRMVESAHSLRALNGSPLLEEHCILGLFKGLNRHFNAIKVNWQLAIEEFTSLDVAIRKVNAAGQNMKDNESDQPSDEQPKRKSEVNTAGGHDEKRKANDDRRPTAVSQDAEARFARY